MARELLATVAPWIVGLIGLVITIQQAVYVCGGPGLAEWVLDWLEGRGNG